MLTEGLLQAVLLQPPSATGANRLQIVSGYATASMADFHINQLSEQNTPADIELIVGMAGRDAIKRPHHLEFKKLSQMDDLGMDFQCRYVVERAPVHAKVYCWLRNDVPVAGFVGSANYSRTAFSEGQVEVMHEADGQGCHDFFNQVNQRSEDCTTVDIESKITLTETTKLAQEGEKIRLSLLASRTGDTPPHSGINWGHRGGEKPIKRDLDQAYIQIPAPVGRSGFFPNPDQEFTVLTDDGQSFIMIRAQVGGKGMHTTRKNALLGAYFRSRLGLRSGQYVTKEHLLAYGRTDVTFTKIDNETYLMDFRPVTPGTESPKS